MFRLLLGHHQVSVSIKVLNLDPIWIHIMGYLYTIQRRTCNKTLRVMYYLQINWAETGRIIMLPVKCQIKAHSYSLTHGAEPILRSCQLCSYSSTSQHFMEPDGSLPR
jgi:hypothetical protein